MEQQSFTTSLPLYEVPPQAFSNFINTSPFSRKAAQDLKESLHSSTESTLDSKKISQSSTEMVSDSKSSCWMFLLHYGKLSFAKVVHVHVPHISGETRYKQHIAEEYSIPLSALKHPNQRKIDDAKIHKFVSCANIMLAAVSYSEEVATVVSHFQLCFVKDTSLYPQSKSVLQATACFKKIEMPEESSEDSITADEASKQKSLLLNLQNLQNLIWSSLVKTN